MKENRSGAIKLVFVPLLITAFIFLTAFTLIHWLIIEMYTITDEHELIGFFLPFPLALITILIFLRRSIGLLKLDNVRGRWGFYYFAMLAIGLPAMFAQRYLLTTTGKHTVLDNIEQYEQKPLTKYYSVRNLYIDKDRKAVFQDEYVSGKSKNKLHLDIYIAAPVLVNAADTPATQMIYWLCQRYSLSLDNNRLTDYQKETAMKTFRLNTLQNFERSDYHNIRYWEVLPKGAQKDKFKTAIADARILRENAILFSPKKGTYENRSGNRGWWTLGSFGIAMVVWLLMVIWCGIDITKADLR